MNFKVRTCCVLQRGKCLGTRLVPRLFPIIIRHHIFLEIIFRPNFSALNNKYESNIIMTQCWLEKFNMIMQGEVFAILTITNKFKKVHVLVIQNPGFTDTLNSY